MTLILKNNPNDHKHSRTSHEKIPTECPRVKQFKKMTKEKKERIKINR